MAARVQQAIVELATLNNPNARVQQAVIEMVTLSSIPPPVPAPPTSNPAITGGAPYGIPPPVSTCRRLNGFDACQLAEIRKLRAITFPPMCIIPSGLDPFTLPCDDDSEAPGFIPEQCVPFYKTGGIVTPTTAAGDVTVISFRVPPGYDGLLTGLYFGYSGNGFSQGSGDLLFRVRTNQVYLKDLGAVPFLLGSSQQPCPMTQGAPLLSSQLVSVIVNVPNLSGNIQTGASTIYCGMNGFWWPRT
jgi:hypothetical protein